MADSIDKYSDIIDLRDVIARVEELEDSTDAEELEELKMLQDLLSELAGRGGDEQWRGDWYPVTLIRDSYFEEYAQELAEDIDAIDSNAKWPMSCIDWDQAARELQMDYFSVDFDGVQFWTR